MMKTDLKTSLLSALGSEKHYKSINCKQTAVENANTPSRGSSISAWRKNTLPRQALHNILSKAGNRSLKKIKVNYLAAIL